MAVGEKIQKYRKSLGLSQEELGQKLLVSRQTISLWEKDQTVPTIDNLMRLSEIFEISVDEILHSESKEQSAEIQPNESYRFTFLKQELNEIYRLQRKSVYKRPIVFTILCVLMILFFIGSSAPDVMIGFAFGMFLIGAVSHIKGIRTYSKAWKNSIEKICKSTYEYKVFDNYISVNIYRENEKIRESKCLFTDIEQIQQFGKWLFLQFGGQSFILRKSELKENSAFYSYMYRNPANTVDTPVPNKWRTTSILLFVASLLSILGAIALVGAMSEANGLFTENMWAFFLMTPIPIASIVFGYILKSKGYKYKKNIVTGIIMTALLCIYGSFVFVF
ncbi:MAG: helix-turn-helix transcriptional regulator [Clostridia bacterium]|nr:helix-turn-helix transcriptional regulator [Clostridia bacterium]